jgi:8-oxo-dGTP diphosphatase
MAAQQRLLVTTLLYILDRSKPTDKEQDLVLLAEKKRGFGVGRLNGPGGKLEPSDSSVAETALRESAEEVGLRPKSTDSMRFAGCLEFDFVGKPAWAQRCFVFCVERADCDGIMAETEEMRPDWFPVAEMPLGKMWPDDEFWLPGVLAGGEVWKRFGFDGDVITSESDLEKPAAENLDRLLIQTSGSGKTVL